MACAFATTIVILCFGRLFAVPQARFDYASLNASSPQPTSELPRGPTQEDFMNMSLRELVILETQTFKVTLTAEELHAAVVAEASQLFAEHREAMNWKNISQSKVVAAQASVARAKEQRVGFFREDLGIDMLAENRARASAKKALEVADSVLQAEQTLEEVLANISAAKADIAAIDEKLKLVLERKSSSEAALKEARRKAATIALVILKKQEEHARSEQTLEAAIQDLRDQVWTMNVSTVGHSTWQLVREGRAIITDDELRVNLTMNDSASAAEHKSDISQH